MNLVPYLTARRTAFVSAVVASSSLAIADVRVVSSSGPYTTIQSAITAAADGDMLLVKPGTYTSFILNAKSLTIVADTGGAVNIPGACIVRNLTASQHAVLSGLTIAVPDNSSGTVGSWAGLLVTNNAGEVRVNACTAIGGAGAGGDGVQVASNSGGVVLVGCTARGGRGEDAPVLFGGPPERGGSGVDCRDSRVALYDCTITGGRGGDGFDNSAQGGNGVWLRTSTAASGLFASGCQITGGRGGDDWENSLAEFTNPGWGGNGLELDGGTHAQFVACSFAGGAPGVGLFCTPVGYPPGPGLATHGTGSMFTFNTTKVVLGAPTVMRESSSLPITVAGHPGDRAYLFVSRGTSFNALPSWRGVLLTQNATPPRTMILGTIPPSGVLSASLAIPDLGPGVAARDTFLQAYRSDANGSITLGNLAVVSVLDSSY